MAERAARNHDRDVPGVNLANEEEEKKDDENCHGYGREHNEPIIRDFAGAEGGVTWRLRKWIKKARLSDHLAGDGVPRDHKTTKSFFKALETVKCAECDGYGHTDKKCPTKRKIVRFASGHKTIQAIINASRKQFNYSHGGREFLGKHKAHD